MKFTFADLFCGCGGATTGVLLATERRKVKIADGIAINHWPTAVETHSSNHANVRHLCESIERVDPCEAVPNGRLELLWASPECTHHSRARGGKPRQNQSRAGASHVLTWLDKLYIKNVIIENVPEFAEWGPLNTKGQPIKSKVGESFRAFLDSLRARNYNVDYRILNAADYGDATTRRRLFIIARRMPLPVIWPEPTHRPDADTLTLFGNNKRWRTAREIIDWTDLGTPLSKKPLKTFEVFSCTGNKPSGKFKTFPTGVKVARACAWEKTRQKSKKPLKPILKCPKCGSKVEIVTEQSPLSPNTMRRIIAGLEKFSGIPFILETRSDGDRVRGIDRPLQTVTTESRSIGLVGAAIVGAGGQEQAAKPRSVNEPLGTVMTQDRRGVATIVGAGGPTQAGEPKSVDAPLNTILSKECRGIASVIVPTNYGEREGQAPRSHDPDKPLPAIVGSKTHGIASYVLGQQSCAAMRSVDEPLPTIATDGAIALTTPVVIQTDQMSGKGRSESVDQPLHTVVTKQNAALVTSFVLPKEGIHKGNAPRSVEKPIPTVTAEHGGGYIVSLAHGKEAGKSDAHRAIDPDQPLPTQHTSNKFAVAQPFIVRTNNKTSNETSPKSVDKPMPTVTTAPGLAVVNPKVKGKSFLVSTRHGAEARTADAGKPLPTITTKGEWGIATPFIVRLRGTGKKQVAESPQPVDAPIGTVSTSGAHHALIQPKVQPYITTYYGNGGAISVEDPLDTISTRDRFLLVNPQTNEQHEIEIYFRLFKWKELAAAHSFPKKYRFAGNNTAIVKQIGNSNPVELTAALTSVVL